ncbi:MAG TPA: hypothetical protein VKQ30_01035 [Ktedonobacterales bacterium]|nr:hypothetical protein [Ktedonobacterales bacterium]
MIISQTPSNGIKLRTLSQPEMAALYGPFLQRSRRKVMRELFASVLDDPEYLACLQRQLQASDIPALLLPAGESGAVSRLLPGLEATFNSTDMFLGAALRLPLGTPQFTGTARRPLILDGQLWLSMMRTSAKALDLHRDPRIVLTSIVIGPEPAAEIKIRGRAQEVIERTARSSGNQGGTRPH